MLFFIDLFFLTVRADAAKPWQLGFQDPATPVIEGIIHFHHELIILLVVITIFVG